MQSKWLTYGFLSIMVTALVTLAILQYQWLGSVSEGEKERLEESLSASSENFVADFNQTFSDLGRSFKIQVSDREEDIAALLSQSYLNWNRVSGENSSIVKSIYFIKKTEDKEPAVFSFGSDPSLLNKIDPDEEIEEWLADHYKPDEEKHGISLRVRPDFDDPTFISVPLQILDVLTLTEQEFGQNVSVQLSVDQLDDIVLLKLDDEFIKDSFIPSVASTYFTESFADQYHLSIVNETKPDWVYYSTGDKADIPDPDVQVDLNEYNFESLFVFGAKSPLENINVSDSSRRIEMNFMEGISERQVIRGFSDSNNTSVRAHFFSETTNSVTAENTTGLRISKDTTITTALNASIINPGWQFWLTFKDGSLDAFVNKTRIKNLGISFGILFILGISGALIVIFAQRSRQLADQQMLFVAGVSHELRTPLTVIRSAAENLSEGVIQTEERKQQYADLMLKEGRRLSDMVDQIMEFSGIQSGKRIYHFTEVNIESFVDSIKEECFPLLEEQSVTLDYSIQTRSKEVYADPEALFLSVTNLIQNAVKFKGDSSSILLKLDDVSLKGNAALRIQVQDYGIGIPESEQKDIFKPFFRGEKPVAEQVRGNGIGLSLVQKVAVAHKGEVSLKSMVGEGSVFSFVIPLKGEYGS
ncbi:MAG: HAMP domain-containing sensor histidine kinase [Balneolaceae bacterium]